MIETREYPVPLTEAEIRTAGEIAGEILSAIQKREEIFAAAKDEYKRNIKELRSALAAQLEKIRTKREVREVELEIFFNSPEKGMKEIYLSGNLIDTVQMTEDDEQNLFADAEKTNQDTPEGGKILSDSEMKDEDFLRRRKGIPADPGVSLASVWLNEPDGEECSVCHEAHYVLHINQEKTICAVCREKMNNKKLPEIEALMKHWKTIGEPAPAFFRANFGYGCSHLRSDTTCFRFMLKSGSWGNNIYMAGDYTFEGSEANIFYKNILGDGWRLEEN